MNVYYYIKNSPVSNTMLFDHGSIVFVYFCTVFALANFYYGLPLTSAYVHKHPRIFIHPVVTIPTLNEAFGKCYFFQLKIIIGICF